MHKGDAIGVGIDFLRKLGFFTRNGVLEALFPITEDHVTFMYPHVTLVKGGDKVSANFGGAEVPFEFSLDHLEEKISKFVEEKNEIGKKEWNAVNAEIQALGGSFPKLRFCVRGFLGLFLKNCFKFFAENEVPMRLQARELALRASEMARIEPVEKPLFSGTKKRHFWFVFSCLSYSFFACSVGPIDRRDKAFRRGAIFNGAP